MFSVFGPKAVQRCKSLFLFSSLIAVSFAIAIPAQDARPSPISEHQPLVSAKINAMAHHVMESGLKANALNGSDLQPWHMKVDFQILLPGASKSVGGTMEEWYKGPYQWRRTYSSPSEHLNGSEWSVTKTEHYMSDSSKVFFSYSLLNLRIARPIINPLYQAANIHPDYEMEVARVPNGSLNLVCASVIEPSRYAPETNPDWLFPVMCFDSEMHLRLTDSSKTVVQFDDIQLFQKCAVARDIKITEKDNLIATMKVTLLEPWSEANADLLKPDKSAVPEPYHIEPGMPLPESIYEVAASIPFRPDNVPYRGTASVPVILHKDGSVKAVSLPIRGGNILYDALSDAVGKWKFKPYLVDGEPVEVSMTIYYVLDGKPFVPSYARPKPAPVVTAPEDYSSAYDSKRDPEKDLAMAEAAAARDHKRILVEVGGEWCSWCKILDTFFTDHADLRQQREANFVLLKVYMGPRNENIAFLSRFPKIPGYPYFFILDADGKVLGAKDTSPLENRGGGYDVREMKSFLTAWNPQ